MKKTIVALFMCLVMVFSTAAYAVNLQPSVSVDVDAVVGNINGDLVESLTNEYAEIYTLEDFTYEYQLREEQGVEYIDLDINATMTLTRPADESPFIQGLQQAKASALTRGESVAIQKEIDFYTDEINMYYMVPDAAVFTYSFPLKNAGRELYYRQDTSEGVSLVNVENLEEVENTSVAIQRGIDTGIVAANMITTAISNSTMATRWKYNRIAARDWAYQNYNKNPEYPSPALKDGSDCANFVSKSLNAGGIPQDKTGGWNQAATWGALAGINWMRTGYYPANGGVVPYMTGKGYFNYVSSANYSRVYAGSIMYWTAKSHVALVTYGDTVTVKYTQHSDPKKDAIYRNASGTQVPNVCFYMPSSSIM